LLAGFSVFVVGHRSHISLGSPPKLRLIHAGSKSQGLPAS